MNLKELLKIDTTKTNWYKVFDKHGINPKTIDAVSNSQQNNNQKEYYYYYVEEYSMFKELIRDLSLVTLNGYLITKLYGEEKTAEAPLLIGSWNESRFYTGYFKILKEDIIVVDSEDGNTQIIGKLSGDLLNTLIISFPYNTVQISKEQYYSHCDIKFEDMSYIEP